MERKLRILFLCTGNSCRSQMAEGWTRKLKGKLIEAYSAGIKVHDLNKTAVEVMAEVGIDISRQTSKHIDTLKNMEFDAVITVCDNARETCPFFPRAKKIVHCGFKDPPAMAQALAATGASEEAQRTCYRQVRDEIQAFVKTLPASLEVELRSQ
ncbi:MAG: arsenate reductase ArsC [Legionella sp.]|uniref:arsenate reductase ArsC n=1 Tax=Legionella sp. TaxID=459 RepID=UPI00284785C4|nr:arsenate reductase ArsC [Legionella sp.]